MANEFKEFVKSHTGGWGKIPLPKSEKLRVFRLDTVGVWADAATICKVAFITPKGVTKNADMVLSHILEKATWFLPESKYINCGLGTLRAVALPLRQYAKALTLQNITFQSALPFIVPQAVAAVLNLNAANAMAYYDTMYPSYKEAYKELVRGLAFSRAFDKRFMLSLHPETEYPLVIYRGNILGYDEGSRIVCSQNAECWRDSLLAMAHKEVIIQ